jgi:hypothetical protein
MQPSPTASMGLTTSLLLGLYRQISYYPPMFFVLRSAKQPE